MQETRRTESRPPPRTSSGVEEHISVNIRESERRVDGDDEVQILQESVSVSDVSPDPRRKRRSGTYKTVDSNAYGEGMFRPRPQFDGT